MPPLPPPPTLPHHSPPRPPTLLSDGDVGRASRVSRQARQSGCQHGHPARWRKWSAGIPVCPFLPYSLRCHHGSCGVLTVKLYSVGPLPALHLPRLVWQRLGCGGRPWADTQQKKPCFPIIHEQSSNFPLDIIYQANVCQFRVFYLGLSLTTPPLLGFFFCLRVSLSVSLLLSVFFLSLELSVCSCLCLS